MKTKAVKQLTILIASMVMSVGVMAHQHGGDHEMDREKRADMREKMKEHHKMRHEKMLQELDSNDDGKVDLNEFLANAEVRFRELDADGDGFVTQDEARSHHKQLRKKHMKMRKEMRKEMREDMGDAEEE